MNRKKFHGSLSVLLADSDVCCDCLLLKLVVMAVALVADDGRGTNADALVIVARDTAERKILLRIIVIDV